MRFIQCSFIFALPILRSHPLVPRRKLVPFLFFYVFHFRFLFYFDTSNKPLNKSQTRRPDPFRLSAVTTRGLCLYSGGDFIWSFLQHP